MALTEIDPALRSEAARLRATRAPAQLDLRKITTPILLHLLRGKVRYPWLFLVKCKLTASRFRKTIDPRFPAEMIDMCTLPLWVYINLKKELGQKTAFEMMRVAISREALLNGTSPITPPRRIAPSRTSATRRSSSIRAARHAGTRWR